MTTALTHQKQKPDQSLKSVASALVSPGLLKNKVKDIRLLVACCIADILRIYAPNPPYDKKQIQVQHACPACLRWFM